jgi:predicted nucleotidyltransferase
MEMVNKDILSIKDSIRVAVGDTCEKIILFGSYAYGMPRRDSDYDFFVVLQDGSENPILSVQKIYRHLAQTRMATPVDVLASYKSRFEARSKLPAIERQIAQKGVVLYERS